MTNAVLAELRHDGAGRLSHRGARYLLIRPETLAALPVLSGRPRVTETACAAAGAEACRFEARV